MEQNNNFYFYDKMSFTKISVVLDPWKNPWKKRCRRNFLYHLNLY